jgi:hypothetical protein
VEEDRTAALRQPDGSRNQEGSGTAIKSILVIFLKRTDAAGELRARQLNSLVKLLFFARLRPDLWCCVKANTPL